MQEEEKKRVNTAKRPQQTDEMMNLLGSDWKEKKKRETKQVGSWMDICDQPINRFVRWHEVRHDLYWAICTCEIHVACIEIDWYGTRSLYLVHNENGVCVSANWKCIEHWWCSSHLIGFEWKIANKKKEKIWISHSMARARNGKKFAKWRSRQICIFNVA